MDIEVQTAIIGAIALLIGALITAIFKRSDKSLEVSVAHQQAQYNQLQEDLNAERKQRQLDIARIHDLLSINHVTSDYALALRQHIIDEKPPPPPPWPTALIGLDNAELTHRSNSIE